MFSPVYSEPDVVMSVSTDSLALVTAICSFLCRPFDSRLIGNSVTRSRQSTELYSHHCTLVKHYTISVCITVHTLSQNLHKAKLWRHLLIANVNDIWATKKQWRSDYWTLSDIRRNYVMIRVLNTCNVFLSVLSVHSSYTLAFIYSEDKRKFDNDTKGAFLILKRQGCGLVATRNWFNVSLGAI